MITIIYRLMVAMVIALVGWNLFTEKKLANQMNCAMVLIPLVLRALMIK
ncbi:MAG: hypothetical protein IKB79_02600 [Oscillospiraceae bacterium]|nr:hypothetical protein [Oscillospiraceae bacterium]